MEFYAGVTKRNKVVAEQAPQENNRPWQTSGLTVEVEDILSNELEDLYNEVVAQTLPSAKKICYTCGKPVLGNSRISDGEFFWHIGCGGTNQKKFKAELVDAT